MILAKKVRLIPTPEQEKVLRNPCWRCKIRL
ncbi:Uncharacterized protein BC141101_00890 [Bacillus toyonensis]|nr:Uncharacterized protein BC141101_00890 [Bacillus toyonensis]